jgi:2-dehydro-3-deoxyphosphogalactonate aldolase
MTAETGRTHARTPAPPLVAILRGLEPERAGDVGRVLFDAGFRVLEVPLNRPGALLAIERLVHGAPADAMVGAGTVIDVAQVEAVAAAGGQLIVSPHCDVSVIECSRKLGLYSAPGIYTATEAFTALRAGAQALKLFPAEMFTPAGVQALATVLPAGTPLWPVGGITPASLAGWRAAGATGFGIGSALFKPGVSLQELATRARAFVDAWQAQSGPR